MLKHRNRLIAAAGAAAAAGAIAVTGVIAASASPHHSQPALSGTEHFQAMSTTGTGNNSSVIASGVFTAGGTGGTGSGPVGTFTFPHGTVKIRHSPGHGSQRFNPKTCLLTVNARGTYKLLSGTGAYAGISGHGTYQLSILAVAKRMNGKCSPRGVPVAYQQVIRASGPASLP